MKRDIIVITITLFILLILNITKCESPLYFLSNDFCIQAYQATNTKEVNNNIAIVNVKDFPIDVIRDQIEILSLYNPKVIGVDYFLDDALFIDSAVASSDKLKLKNIVLPMLVDITDTPKYSYNYFTDSCYYGAVKIHSSSYFYPFITVSGYEYASLPTKMIELFDSTLYTKLKRRKFNKEIINYTGNVYQFKYLDDLTKVDPAQLETIKGKIVLVGYLGMTNPIPENDNDQDIHFTPNSLMYGTVILANILSTLMNDYITPVHFIWMTLIVIVIVLLNLKIAKVIYSRRSNNYLFLKFVQVIEIVLLFFLCSVILHFLKVILDFESLVIAAFVSSEFKYWLLKLNSKKSHITEHP